LLVGLAIVNIEHREARFPQALENAQAGADSRLQALKRGPIFSGFCGTSELAPFPFPGRRQLLAHHVPVPNLSYNGFTDD